MKWEGERQSSNVEDRRGDSGGGGLRIGGGGIGVGTIVVALIASWAFGINPLTVINLLNGGDPETTSQETPAAAPPEGDTQARFVSTVLASTEDVWTQIFTQAGKKYVPPRLVLYRGAYPTACGQGQAAMGPFYCPSDQKVYIDLSFYDTLRNQLDSPGDFAQAYVIAHEVGHHVQNLLGITARLDEQRGNVSERTYNALSVRLELQADCFAGVWANRANTLRGIIEPGDIDEAINAASQIGDDTLQRKAQGQIVPDSFTHGTSAQRVTWFKRGWESGSVQKCDTFSAQSL